MQAQWRDRGPDFNAPYAGAPLAIQGTKKARNKFGLDEGKEAVTEVPLKDGYSVRGARGLNSWAIRQMLEQLMDLNQSERRQLARTSPYALRHAFGTQSVAAGVPLDVVRRIMGHASTWLYVLN